MRRKMLGSMAVFLAGGAALAQDGLVPLIPGNPPVNQQAVDGLPPIAGEPSCPQTLIEQPTPADGRVWGRADYVLFWMAHNPTPLLVQTIPASVANFSAGGGLPPGAATTIFGAHGIDPQPFSGIRAELGFYFDDAKCWGMDGSYLQMFQKATTFQIASPGQPVIGRDFFDAGADEDSFLRYTTPDGTTTGYIRVDAPVSVYTFDTNLRAQGPSVLSDRVDYLLGVRYLNLRDSIDIDSGATVNSTTGGPPFVITSHEGFHASNEFWGGQVGFDTHYRWGCWSFEVEAKVALGDVHQDVKIEGWSTTQLGSAPVQIFPNQSILYVQPTNAGNHSRNRFAVVPDALATLGYQINSHLRATIGYDVLVLSSAERSGEAIDRDVNPSMTKFIQTQKASSVQAPGFTFGNADAWWAQGLTAGLAFTY